jgi:hypothetical protein
MTAALDKPDYRLQRWRQQAHTVCGGGDGSGGTYRLKRLLW